MLKDALPKIISEELPGAITKEILKIREENTAGAIKPLYPLSIKSGQGAMVEDFEGNRYVDFVGGVGVLNIGYSHPEVIEVVKQQADSFFHSMYNITTHENYGLLAKKLNEIAPTTGTSRKTYFANSGAEAIENAIKVAKSATGRKNIIAFTGAFHGRTLMAVTLTAKKSLSKGIGADAPGVFRAKYPYLYRKPEAMSDQEMIDHCIESISQIFEHSAPADEVAGIIMEPLQGEGGFVPAPIEFVKALRQVCDDHGIVLIADEVQSGFCRTGRMFCTDYWAEAGVRPDIICVAKSIAAGMPLSGIVVNGAIMDRVLPSTIGGTFGGNAMSVAAGLKVIEIMEREKLDERALEIGATVTKRYEEFARKYPFVGDYRGIGAMIGLELVKDKDTKEPYPEKVNAVIDYCFHHGLLIENAGAYGNVIRFLAPLVITDAQLLSGLDILDDALANALA
ncbi:MAG: aspartate aminotransferase family protein [Erysipelotrichaceae bacterium]|nr:aspartate aminotransferase family protein [Erysipelotrichaceae bacterium]MDD3810219.1 aspartate aminotransferase family protein [Erysipelotrichaceae bacterium]